ncbi:MAG TPA: hypothetical protein VM511_11935, partial [Luteolibacter sp.]|nr:hypothetical protein [Luteolibacter sp.]
SFSLVFSGSPSPLLEISGLEGSVPVGGGPANSTLTVKSLRSIGGAIAGELKLPVNWQAPLLTLPPLDITASGLKTRIGGQLAMVQGLPIALECNAPAQSVKPVSLPGGGTFRSQDISSVLRFGGMLVTPSTWQAEFITAASKPAIVADGHETRFDHAQAVTVLRGGTLSCVDARITGDDVSMLGNATVLSNGKAAGVLRIVAPQETSLSIIRRLFPGATAPPAFSSMSTPQRAALDIEVSGTLGDLNIRLGKNGPFVGRPTPPDSAKSQ